MIAKIKFEAKGKRKWYWWLGLVAIIGIIPILPSLPIRIFDDPWAGAGYSTGVLVCLAFSIWLMVKGGRK